MSRVVITLLVVAVCQGGAVPSAQAYDWQYVGMDGVLTTCIEDDFEHDRVLVGTAEGFRVYDLATGQWNVFEDDGWIGRTVHAVAADPLDAGTILTGRFNAFFKEPHVFCVQIVDEPKQLRQGKLPEPGLKILKPAPVPSIALT